MADVETKKILSTPGVWMCYDHGADGYYVIALYSDVWDAVRRTAIRGYGRAGYWPFGTGLQEAMHTWEGRG